MALNRERELALADASLVAFFERNRDLYRDLARDAYGFAAKPIEEAHQEVRQDDVIPALELALRISEPLRVYLAGRKLRQMYWYTWFAELIVDRLWEALRKK